MLLLQRPPPCAPEWHPVTGHVEPGESFEDAARREAFEETGCAGDLVDLAFAFAFRGRWRGTEYLYEERAFGLRTDSSACRLSREHVAFRWAGTDAALGVLRWREHAEALRRLAPDGG